MEEITDVCEGLGFRDIKIVKTDIVPFLYHKIIRPNIPGNLTDIGYDLADEVDRLLLKLPWFSEYCAHLDIYLKK